MNHSSKSLMKFISNESKWVSFVWTPRWLQFIAGSWTAQELGYPFRQIAKVVIYSYIFYRIGDHFFSVFTLICGTRVVWYPAVLVVCLQFFFSWRLETRNKVDIKQDLWTTVFHLALKRIGINNTNTEGSVLQERTYERLPLIESNIE